MKWVSFGISWSFVSREHASHWNRNAWVLPALLFAKRICIHSKSYEIPHRTTAVIQKRNCNDRNGTRWKFCATWKPAVVAVSIACSNHLSSNRSNFRSICNELLSFILYFLHLFTLNCGKFSVKEKLHGFHFPLYSTWSLSLHFKRLHFNAPEEVIWALQNIALI